MAISRWSSVIALVVVMAISSSSWSEGAGSGHHAPAPAVDCSSLILNMADCLSFVSNDSTTEKPEGTCCSGLKIVLKTGPDCLCEAFKSSAQLGVVLNVTKAISLPAACKVSAPSATNCGLVLTPTGAPAISPSSSASAPDAGSVSTDKTPAPSPGPEKAGATTGISFSVGSIVISLIMASLSSF